MRVPFTGAGTKSRNDLKVDCQEKRCDRGQPKIFFEVAAYLIGTVIGQGKPTGFILF